MLSRDSRVSHTLFATVMEHGKSFHAPNLSLRYFLQKTPTQSRISVVVPKKVSPKATYRNKLRRKLYPIIRVYKQQLPAHSVGIIFVKKDISKVTGQELHKELREMLQKAFNIVL